MRRPERLRGCPRTATTPRAHGRRLPRLSTTLPLTHNNLTKHYYVAVVVEGAALPLVHTAWITAAAFTVVNAGLLAVRIRAENAALAALHA